MNMKKTMSILLAVLLACLLPCAASAISPRYTYVDCVVSIISLDNKVATVSADVEMLDSKTSFTASIRLQQSPNGKTWTTLKTWSKSGTGALTFGTTYGDGPNDKTLLYGYQYRTVVVVTAKGETVTSESPGVVCDGSSTASLYSVTPIA